MVGSKILKPKKKITTTRVIAGGFLLIIFLGAALLSLPVASRSGETTPFIDALFTSTSATCVTGLAVYDTFAHWSIFGQLVILTLIQIGGLGLMTVISLVAVFLKRKISLGERRLLMQSAGNMRLSGIVVLIRRIAIGTFIFEALGAAALATRFCPEMGIATGLYNAMFHSVSAFCNAGFDIMGKYGEFSSLGHYAADAVVNITIMALIIIGGIGFMVWSDIIKNKFHFSKYELHSKIVLSSTLLLIVFGFVLFFIFEYDGAFAGLSNGKKVLMAMFQSVTPRTAGFSTIDLNSLSSSSSVLTMFLMLIGGSPGSTAGGIKTTTLVVLIFAVISCAKNDNEVVVFKRRIQDSALKHASAILSIYLLALLASVMLIAAAEDCSLKSIVFEAVSAIGTVGLSEGITPKITLVSKVVLMLLMFAGRIGGLSLALVLAEKRIVPPVKRPAEKILIG